MSPVRRREQCAFRNGRDEVHIARAITSLLAGLFALLMVPLSLQVSVRRVKLGGALTGDANDDALRRRIRAHGNRALHAIGMLYSSTPTLRASGMLIQHLAFLSAGAWLAYQSVLSLVA